MTILQDFELIEYIAEGAAEFSQGKPIEKSIEIGTTTWEISVVELGANPTPDYAVFSGSALGMIELTFMEYATLQSGLPVKVAEKINNMWYGETLTRKAA